MIRPSSALLVWVVGLALPALVQAQSDRMPVVRVLSRLVPDRSSPGDWPKYCGNLGMTSEASDESSITRATVGALSPLWTSRLAGSVASSPTVVSETVYVGDWTGFEWALDAGTGKVKASVNLGHTAMPQCTPPLMGITSAPAVSRDMVFVAGGDDAFYALDAETLAVRWRKVLGDNSALGGYYGWCSPLVIGGRVLQGVSSDCDDPYVPGKLLSFDRDTGTLLQEADMVPPTNPGGGIWTSPSLDVESGDVFVTTASATTAEGHAYSIVRLSFGDLSIDDYWKADPGNTVDADWGSSPTLFTEASGRKLVGAGQKDGYYYAFVRGKLAAGPIWRALIALGGPCPQCGNGVLSTAAFDGKRLYVGGGAPPDWKGGVIDGSVVALDPATGAILWRHIFPTGPVIAPVSVANGVVFAAGGQSVAALDAQTGAMLWHFESESPFYGGIAISKGRIYFGDVGGLLYAFGLSGSGN
jgi:polyvinyl alcohol dehydrogenase (cytochrome)